MDSPTFRFDIVKSVWQGKARLGLIQTPHGSFQTPVFMPVGTRGTVKAMTPNELREVGTEILLGNTFHLMLRPGAETIRELGGLHRFMSWPGPILTDSGGFQVFSLAKMSKVTAEGVTFQSPLDGSTHQLTPERAMEVQTFLGSDIAMILDECLPHPAPRQEVSQAMERTLDWSWRCRRAARDPQQAVFGIVQGGMFRDLRRESARSTVQIDFAGYAVGGLSVGEPKPLMFELLEICLAELPAAKPRYLMGAGTPHDLVRAIDAGVDMFDCVLPTRNARNGLAFTAEGLVKIKHTCHTGDAAPLSMSCPCSTCRGYSRAYLRHLYLSNEILSARLLTYHNLFYYHALIQAVRDALRENRWRGFRTFALPLPPEDTAGDLDQESPEAAGTDES